MKRKFILLAMMLLTLIGGVNLNVLNAQEDVVAVHEDATSTITNYPIAFQTACNFSQHIYVSSDLNHGAGIIDKIAFKVYTTQNGNRSITLYLKNTSSTTLSSWEIGSTQVFQATLDPHANNNGWLEFDIDDFEYDGTNILVSCYDNAGESYLNGTSATSYRGSGAGDVTIYYNSTSSFGLNEDNVPNNTGYTGSRQPAIKFFFAEPADNIIPAAPTNLAVAECTHNSVSLTWTAGDEYAKKYNVHVYNNGVEITGSPFTSTETAYTVEGLDAETTYTFKVQSVRGNNLSENFSNEASATTLEYNDPLVGKQFRLRALTYIERYEYWGNAYYYGPYELGVAKYLHIDNTAAAGLKVIDKVDSNAQRFTFEPTGNVEGQYYLRSADGYYINCGSWDVSAYDESQKSPIEVVYLDDTKTQFYLTNGTGRHFKVETAYGDGVNFKPFCDAAQQYAAKWIVEEVEFQAIATVTDEEIYDDQTTTLSVTAFDGSGYTYSWSPAEGLDDATSANPTFTPATTGEHTFTCTVTDTESGSTAEASVTVYVNARPALQLTVSADKGLIYNDGETAVLTATVTEGTGYAPYTYSWTLNGEAIEGATEATYTFSNTTVGECTLTCTVTDTRNNTQTASTTIEVKDVSEKPLEIVIGSNEFGQNNIPLDSYYYAAFSQQIYTSDQIGQSGCIINDISFYRTENIGLNNRNIEIYLLNTDKSKFDNSNDWVKLSENDKVYANSSYTNDGLGWFTFTLDTPFEYTGGNLLVCMRVIKNNKYTNHDKYAAFNTENSRALYRANDNDTYNISNITQIGTLLNQLNHIKFGYELIPQNLVATPAQIHVGNTTTLTWEAFEGAESYNIYVDGVLKDNTEKLTYELSDLTYNVEPGHTIGVAAVYEDETESGKASVTVQVAGTFTLTVNVTDGTSPIVGATVEIDMTSAYDEFFNKLEMEVEPLTTNAQGVANVTLPLLAKNYDYYGGMWLTPLYTVKASKTPYSDSESDVYCTYISNLQTVERTLVLTLPMVNYIQVQDEEGEYLYGDVMEGTKVVLSWEAVEGSDAYKVSKLVDGEVESSETITETTYTIEGVLKGYQYAVSALFGELESVKTTANIDVKGNGYFKGYVTDGTNALEGIQVKVSSEYGASAVATTDAEGYFNGAIVEGDNYILTISHSDYEEFTSETFTIGYEAEYDFETITLTAKPSASDITVVTATLNGENVDVEWTVNETSTYTKYNVYRRLAGTQGKGDNIATEVTTTITTDAAWETLDPGTYEYGVAALVEPQAQARGTEVIFEEGFETTETNEVPEGWYKISGNWRVTNYSNSGGVLSGSKHLWTQYMEKGDHYLVMPAIAPAGATLSFVYRSAPWSGTYDDLTICYSTSQNGPWTKINDEVYRETSKTQVSIPLDNIEASTVYIAFCMTARYADGIYIDDVVVTREKASLVETQIVWSNEVVKQGPNTFIGGDTENPTAWNVDANWSHGNVPATGDEVIVNAEAVISGNVELSTLDIVGNGRVTVDANASLTVTGAITQEQDYSLIMNDGAQVFQNNANVTAQFNMNLVNPSDWSTSNKDGWQFISSPLSNVNVTNIAEGNYDLYKYDGEKEYEWVNHKDVNFADNTYQHHIGYLASHETKTTLEFKGTLNYNDYYGGSYAFFEYTPYSEDKLMNNYYLLGNPYPFNIKWADCKNSQGIVNGFAYVKDDGNYEYATSGEIAVGDGFFVQAISGTGETDTYCYYVKGSGNTRSTKESNNSLNITATGNAGKDNVVINFAGKSEGFDKLQNFNDAIATVYVAEGGKNYGIYNCDADVQEVELSFNANKMGNYTISIEPNGKFETVTLVDRFTGVETNMLVEDYNFTAMSSDNHNRFIVRFANGQQTTDNSHFVYQSGEELILNIQGEVQIVDVLGRVVYNGEAMNDINRINVSSFNSGAYMVKVMNGNEVKVEKVVIY